jgi:myo-inositol-1(or 4)-monophosphatase
MASTVPRPLTLAAIRIAREAAQTIRRATRPRRVRLKTSTADLLTATDLEVEAMIRRRLATLRPDHTVVGEEGGDPGELDLTRPTWFVDPVDGTMNYFRDLAHHACSLALWKDNEMRLGIVADVALRRIYWAEAGRGAYQGRRRLRVAPTSSVTRGVLATGFPADRATASDDNHAEFSAVLRPSRGIRQLGCASLDLASVAAGRLDAYWEQRCGPWDWAAGSLLVREAGGRITTYDGTGWWPGDRDLIASNGPLHEELLRTFATARAERGLPPRPGMSL